MVSEGVDVPRLAVGVYATSASTPLFFAQAIGRFVRARRRGETASVFLPNVPQLLALARRAGAPARPRARPRQRRRRQWALEEDLMDAAEREDKASDALDRRVHLPGARLARPFRPRALRRQGVRQLAVPGTPEEEEFLGPPGLLEPEHVHELLHAAAGAPEPAPAGARGTRGERARRRPAPSGAAAPHAEGAAAAAQQPGRPVCAADRRAARTGPRRAAPGLRRAAVSHATVAQLQARIDVLRSACAPSGDAGARLAVRRPEMLAIRVPRAAASRALG